LVGHIYGIRVVLALLQNCCVCCVISHPSPSSTHPHLCQLALRASRPIIGHNTYKMEELTATLENLKGLVGAGLIEQKDYDEQKRSLLEGFTRNASTGKPATKAPATPHGPLKNLVDVVQNVRAMTSHRKLESRTLKEAGIQDFRRQKLRHPDLFDPDNQSSTILRWTGTIWPIILTNRLFWIGGVCWVTCKVIPLSLPPLCVSYSAPT
jgi:hypothetical protein